MKPMGSVRIPLVTWRDGRPRWFPSPAVRALGFKGGDLRHPSGAWFSADECIAWSKEMQAKIEAARAKPKKAGTARSTGVPASDRRELKGGAETLSLAHIVSLWLRDDPRLSGKPVSQGKRHRKPLAANTIKFYRASGRLLERLDDGWWWAFPAARFDAVALEKLLARVEVKHGLAQARAVRATLSRACWWAVKQRLLAVNPVAASEDTLPVPAPRIRVGTTEEMEALIATADAIGRPDVGDCIVLGLWTAQRQGDRLSLEDGRIAGDVILFRQAKRHGKAVTVPISPQLASRIEAARARRAAWRVNWPHVLLDEVSRRPWAADWYRKVFRVVRDVAATGQAPDTKDARAVLRDVPAQTLAAIKPCPSLAEFRDQDLRDTAVTWLALAGCDKFEIHAITGHELATIDTIMRHYLGAHPQLARRGIGKLQVWFAEQETGR